MKTLAADPNLASLEAFEPKSILTDWLTAISDFHRNYYQLVTCISQGRIDLKVGAGNMAYIGQCPIGQLMDLLSTMQEELRKLGQDIDQLAQLRQSSISKNYKKLMLHTRVLKQLNQQTQSGLYLATLSGS